MSKIVYADHAATTPLSAKAQAAMEPFFAQRFGNPSSLYAFGQQAKTDLEEARAVIARCIGAQPSEGKTRASTLSPPPLSTTPSFTLPSIWKSWAMRSPTCR